jgi:hypothetical protein
MHLLFDGDRVIWSSRDSTSKHADYGREADEIQGFADNLLGNARSAE